MLLAVPYGQIFKTAQVTLGEDRAGNREPQEFFRYHHLDCISSRVRPRLRQPGKEERYVMGKRMHLKREPEPLTI